MKLKVGMSFRVFEVTKKHYDPILFGRWFCEQLDRYYSNDYGVSTPYYEDISRDEHIGIDRRGQGVLKAKLTITKVK